MNRKDVVLSETSRSPQDQDGLTPLVRGAQHHLSPGARRQSRVIMVGREETGAGGGGGRYGTEFQLWGVKDALKRTAVTDTYACTASHGGVC